MDVRQSQPALSQPVLFQSATGAARMLRRREISARELTGMLLERIDRVNPALNAVVELRRQAALEEAAAADETTARGGDVGPLHGVPMTLKDSLAFWISHASLAGLPAVAAPAGRTPGGLPVGAQVVGPLHEDDTAITFAELLGGLAGGYEPPPV